MIIRIKCVLIMMCDENAYNCMYTWIHMTKWHCNIGIICSQWGICIWKFIIYKKQTNSIKRNLPYFFSAAYQEACETFIFRHTVFRILYINTYRYRILASTNTDFPPISLGFLLLWYVFSNITGCLWEFFFFFLIFFYYKCHKIYSTSI